MRRIADRFGGAARDCASLDDLRQLLLDASRELEFSYFALLHHASIVDPAKNFIRIDNYPSEWANELVNGQLGPFDPVHLACRRASAAFRWSELDRIVPVGSRQQAILERSRHFGLGEGLTVPANVPGEPSGSCSFAVSLGAPLPSERIHCAEIVGLRAFEAARRLANFPRVPDRPRLSRREQDCLRLVALGKTDWEIGRILGIGAETARQYVKSARAAYGVATRTQLALLGLRDAFISFDEAVP